MQKENEIKEKHIIVLCSCDSDKIASTIANTLVSKQYAACVNIINGVESVYAWQGKVERATEKLLIIKTRQSLFSLVQNAIHELHDYELPEIIAVSIEAGEKNYLNWISASTLDLTTDNKNEKK
ncbi:MAG: divalent-cation tolerance protein CutA [Woeseiaceae bacterium]